MTSTPRADDTALRRAVWRFEYGHLPERRVKRLLRAAYLRASRDFDLLEAGVPAVRRAHPELLRERDDFRARADGAIRREQFRAALDAILHGRRTLAAMRALVDAASRIARAEAAMRTLWARVPAPCVRTLPCIQTPARLLREAQIRMDARRYTQAAYLADASLAESSPLEPRDRTPASATDGLAARITRLRELCADTRALARVGEADPLADGSLDAVAALLRDGFVGLAERLADELELVMAERARLHRELRRAGPHDEVLRAAAAAGPEQWASATATVWLSRVEAGIRRAAAQRARLDRAGALPGANGERAGNTG